MASTGPRRELRDKGRASARQNLIAGLDVGSSKVSCFIASVEGSGHDGQPVMRVVGIGHQLSRGVRNGAVVDMEAAEQAIRAAVEQAEHMAGVTINSVVAAISCGAPTSHNFNVEVSLAGHEIGDADLKQVVRMARSRCVFEGHDLIHASPVGFTIDGSRGIRDPRGMCGEHLGVTMHVVTANPGPIRNLELCIQRCHLDLQAKVVSGYASGLSALVEDEKDLGVTLIDMGAGTTSIAVFFGGGLLHTDVIPVGGHFITTDIARGLSTPIAHAERLKTLYGSALASPHDDRQMIMVPQVGEEDIEAGAQVPRSVLTGIIRPRLEETFELIQDKLKGTGFEAIAGRRVVLTGGGSLMSGAREVASRILSRQVRLGRPLRLQGLAEATGGASFSVCAGLVHWAAIESPQAGFGRLGYAADGGFAWPQQKLAGLKRWIRAHL